MQDLDLLQKPLLVGISQERGSGSRQKSVIAGRAASCQLPTIAEDSETGPVHRPSQSIDLGSTQLHISWTPPRYPAHEM